MATQSEQFYNDVVYHINSGVERDENTDAVVNPNPHRLSHRAMIDLCNVDNTSDAAKPVSRALSEAMEDYFSVSDLYNNADWGDDDEELRHRPLSAARAAALAEAIASASDIGASASRYTGRISALEDKLGITHS